jgi:hypothetical protein
VDAPSNDTAQPFAPELNSRTSVGVKSVPAIEPITSNVSSRSVLGSIVAPSRFVPSGMPAPALSKTSEYVAPLNETKSAGLTVSLPPPFPNLGTLMVTSKESSRFPEPSIPRASILVPSETPLVAPVKKSDGEKKLVDVLYEATSCGVTVTVPPMPLIGSAAVVSIVSRSCVELIGKNPVMFTPAGIPVGGIVRLPEGKL